MNKNLTKAVSIVITSIFFLTSCITPSKNQNTVNISNQKITNSVNKLSIKSLPMSTEKDIEILQSSSLETITVTTESDYPRNTSVNFQGMTMYSVNKTPEVIPPLTQQQIKDKRKNIITEWKVWFQTLIKSLRQELIKAQTLENQKARKDFENNLANYTKGSPEYKALIEKFNTEREERRNKHKKQRQDFRQAAKTDWQKFRTYLVQSLNNTFSTKGFWEDLGTGFSNWVKDHVVESVIAVVSPVVGAVIVGVEAIANVINNATKTVPENNPNTTVTTVDNTKKPAYNNPIGPGQNDTGNSTATKIESQENITLEQHVDALKTIDQIITALRNDKSTKFVVPVTIKDLLASIGVNISDSDLGANIPKIVDINEINNLQKKGIIALSNLGVFSRKLVDGKNVPIEYDNDGNIKGNPSDIRVVIGFGLPNDTNLYDLVNQMIYAAKNGPWKTIVAQNAHISVEDLDLALNKLKNRTLAISLTSPVICKQNLKTKFETKGIVSFKAALSRKIIYDGEYDFEVLLRGTDTISAAFPIKLSPGKINLAELLKVSLNNTKNNSFGAYPLEVTPLGFHDNHTELESEIITNEEALLNLPVFERISYALGSQSAIYGLHPKQPLSYTHFGFNIKNRTGNLWDMRIKRVGDPENCKPLYISNCVDTSTADILYSKTEFETGLYKLDTSYNMYPDVMGLEGYFYNKYTDFLTTQVNYSTFSRITSKPEESLLYTKQELNQNGNEFDFEHLTANDLNNKYYDVDDDSTYDSIADPALIQNPQSVNVSDNLNPKIKKFMLNSVSAFNNSFEVKDQPKNLFRNLSSKPNLFEQVEIKACPSDEYLHVGAIVDLSSKVARNNLKIQEKDLTIPMVMVIEDKNQTFVHEPTGLTFNKPVRRFAFNAKLGSVTVVQRYWDGSSEINSEDDLESERLPSYIKGNYQVKIYPAKAYNDMKYNIINKFKAYVIEPYITTNSTSASIDINDSQACNLTCNESKTQIKTIQEQIDTQFALLEDDTEKLVNAQTKAEMDNIMSLMEDKYQAIDSLDNSYQIHLNNIKLKCPNCADFGTDLQSQSCLVKDPRANDDIDPSKIAALNNELNVMLASMKDFGTAGFKVKGGTAVQEEVNTVSTQTKNFVEKSLYETSKAKKKSYLIKAKNLALKGMKLIKYFGAQAIKGIFASTLTTFAFTFGTATILLNTYFSNEILSAELETEVVKINKNINDLFEIEVEALFNKTQTQVCIDTENAPQVDDILAEIILLVDNLTARFYNLITAAHKNALTEFKKVNKDITNQISYLKETITSMKDVLNEICTAEKEDNCTVADFNNQGSTNFVSDRIIRCRVKKILVGNKLEPRPFAEKYKLKKYLESTNSLRQQLFPDYGKPTGRRTFGFIIIDNISTIKKSAYPLTVNIKGVSGKDIQNIKDFAPMLPDEKLSAPEYMYPDNPSGRVFHVQYFGTTKDNQPIPRGHDTEPNMLEEVASLYWKNGKQRVNMELFTDRETCGGCDSLIKKINLGLEQTGYRFTINPVTQGIFQASTLAHPNVEPELVPLKSKYFYLRIN